MRIRSNPQKHILLINNIIYIIINNIYYFNILKRLTKKMYEIEKINLKAENVNILNKGKTILLNNNNIIKRYEKSDGSDYKLVNTIIHNDTYGIIYLTMLSNEMILTSSRQTIILYKKEENSSYKIYQRIFNYNWAEIYKIKELDNTNFAVCGWYGFMIFNKHNNEYEISLEINEFTLQGHNHILDFMEIKGKKDEKNSFILYGYEKAFIINDKKIINQITLDVEHKNPFGNNYICQFNDELFILYGKRHITLVNTYENKFKQIDFLDEDKAGKTNLFNIDLCQYVYKYNSNSVILFSKTRLFIIQIINNEKIQVNLCIKLDKYYFPFNYIQEEKAIYFKNFKNKQINKLKIKKKYICYDMNNK